MHVRRSLALLVVAPLLLGGCSDDPEPTPKMPDPTSSSPSPTATESETPEAESPEDFIRRWVAAGDEMQVTGETADYDLMTPKCTPCQDFVANVQEVYDNGGSAEFAGSKIVKLEELAAKPPTFNLTKDIPKTIIHRPNGQTQTLPGGRSTIRVTLNKIDGEWVVSHFVVV